MHRMSKRGQNYEIDLDAIFVQHSERELPRAIELLPLHKLTKHGSESQLSERDEFSAGELERQGRIAKSQEQVVWEFSKNDELLYSFLDHAALWDKVQRLLMRSRARIGHQRLAIHPRDLTKLSDAWSPQNGPGLIVRDMALLVRLPPVCAILLPDRCLLVLPEGADELLSVAMRRLRERDRSEPFDLCVLETLFETVTALLAKNEAVVRDKIQQLTSESHHIHVHSIARYLNHLRNEKDSLSSDVARVRSFSEAIEELLDNESDMKLICTTLHLDPGAVDLLLEAQIATFSKVLTGLKRAEAQIANIENTLGTHLDHVNNLLIAVSVAMAAFNTVMLTLSTVPFIFGMNLNSHLMDEDASFFQGICGAAGGGALLASGLLLLWFWAKGWLIV